MISRIAGAQSGYVLAEQAVGMTVVAHVGLTKSALDRAQRTAILLGKDGISDIAPPVGQDAVAIALASPASRAWLVLPRDEAGILIQRPRSVEFDEMLRAIAEVTASVQFADQRRAEDRIAPLLNPLVSRVAAAPSNVAALDVLVNNLCVSFGAVLCNVWRRVVAEKELRLIAAARRGVLNTSAFAAGQLKMVPIKGTKVGEAISTGRQIITADIQNDDNVSGFNILRAARHGLLAQVCTPFSHGEDHWAIVLGFDRAGLDLEQIAFDLRALSPTMTIILRRRQREANIDLLNRVVEASREAVLVTRAVDNVSDLPIVYANPAFTALSGYDSAEVLGRMPSLLQCADTSRDERRKIGDALRRKEPVQAELLNRRRDGTTYWVDIRISPVFDIDGECTHFVSVQRDTTAERAARLATVERERAFREIFETNPVPMFIKDPNTRAIIDANRAAQELLGFSLEQFRGFTTVDLLEPGERPAAERFWQRMLRDGKGAAGPWRQRTADGRVLRVEATSMVLHVQGRPAVLTAVWDRTAQLEAEEAMRDSREELSRMAQSVLHAQRLAQLGTWNWWPQSRRLEFSAELAVMLGQPPTELAINDDALLAMIHPEDRPAMAQAFSDLGRGAAVSDITFRVAMANGEEHVLLFSGKADDSGATAPCSGFCQDVTQRKLAEARLLRAEKLRSVGELTGGIAHDSNNLLTVINANVELALDAVPTDSPVAGLLANALRAAQAGARLNSQLLSFARRQPMDIRSVAAQPFLAGVADLARHTLGAGCTIVLDEPETALHLRADTAHLETALINLCLNARDAMPMGGTIRISHRRVQFDHTSRFSGGEALPAGLEEMAPGTYVCVSVSDTGTGMTAEIRARIFEPFFTTKTQSGGTGLGLSMVLGFARQSGGGLAVESEPGRGTSFHIYLPLADAPSAVARARPDCAKLLRGRVLLVDDDPALRVSSASLLRSLGLTVDEAPDALEAMASLAAPLRFDLLFTDMELGTQPDGVALCEYARAAWPDLAIVLTSGRIEEEVGVETMARLQAAFLSKPYHRRALRAAMEAALGQSAPLHVS
jgi:PAS domain S-box-containing protein